MDSITERELRDFLTVSERIFDAKAFEAVEWTHTVLEPVKLAQKSEIDGLRVEPLRNEVVNF